MAMPPSRLARHRAAQWMQLQSALARTPALANYAGQPLAAFPIASPGDLRTDYGRWNSLGLSHAQLCALADEAKGSAGDSNISAGWSTGSTSGIRGLFVANAAERADYIGQSLARLLPLRALLRPQRLALHLRSNSELYSDAGRRNFAFTYLPTEASVGDTLRKLVAFAPTILIAPPHRLLALAEAGLATPGLAYVFYGSEPMSDAECAYVADRIGHQPRPIYQATEGFLGAACRNGRLHLNDHSLEIELEPVEGTKGFRPIITDLRRRSQPIVRIRGDDYVELDPEGCGCGFAGRIIAPVAGRADDIWRFSNCAVPASRIVGAVEMELGGTHRWQARGSPEVAVLRTAPECPDNLGARAADRLKRVLPGNVSVRVLADLPPWTGYKRQKVCWSGG